MIDDVLDQLAAAPPPAAPPLGAALEAELAALAPVRPRRPLRQLAVLARGLARSMARASSRADRRAGTCSSCRGLAVRRRHGLARRVPAAGVLRARAAPGLDDAALAAPRRDGDRLVDRLHPARRARAPARPAQPRCTGSTFARGHTCLELGLVTALVPVVSGAIFLRGALPVGSRWTAAALGAGGGALGGSMLHLHCPHHRRPARRADARRRGRRGGAAVGGAGSGRVRLRRSARRCRRAALRVQSKGPALPDRAALPTGSPSTSAPPNASVRLRDDRSGPVLRARVVDAAAGRRPRRADGRARVAGRLGSRRATTSPRGCRGDRPAGARRGCSRGCSSIQSPAGSPGVVPMASYGAPVPGNACLSPGRSRGAGRDVPRAVLGRGAPRRARPAYATAAGCCTCRRTASSPSSIPIPASSTAACSTTRRTRSRPQLAERLMFALRGPASTCARTSRTPASARRCAPRCEWSSSPPPPAYAGIQLETSHAVTMQPDGCARIAAAVVPFLDAM